METLGGSSGRTKYVTGNVTLKAILGLCVCLCACVCLSLPPTHQSWNEQSPTMKYCFSTGSDTLSHTTVV